MDYKSFCTEFTRLLYNIAKREDKDNLFEVEKFKKRVEKELINLEKEEYGLKNAVFTEFEFEYYQEIEDDLQKAVESFIEFLRNKKKVNKRVNDKLKALIIEVIEKFSEEYGISKENDKTLLGRIKEELESEN